MYNEKLEILIVGVERKRVCKILMRFSNSMVGVKRKSVCKEKHGRLHLEALFKGIKHGVMLYGCQIVGLGMFQGRRHLQHKICSYIIIERYIESIKVKNK